MNSPLDNTPNCIQQNIEDRQFQEYGTIIRPRGQGDKRVLTLDHMKTVYHLPITYAANELGVGVTVLKKFCRKFGVKRWPYRKLRSMDKLIESVEQRWCERHPGDRDRLIEAVQDLKRQKLMMQFTPSVDMEVRTKKLRQANFKQEYKWRHDVPYRSKSNSSENYQYSLDLSQIKGENLSNSTRQDQCHITQAQNSLAQFIGDTLQPQSYIQQRNENTEINPMLQQFPQKGNPVNQNFYNMVQDQQNASSSTQSIQVPQNFNQLLQSMTSQQQVQVSGHNGVANNQFLTQTNTLPYSSTQLNTFIAQNQMIINQMLAQQNQNQSQYQQIMQQAQNPFITNFIQQNNLLPQNQERLPVQTNDFQQHQNNFQNGVQGFQTTQNQQHAMVNYLLSCINMTQKVNLQQQNINQDLLYPIVQNQNLEQSDCQSQIQSKELLIENEVTKKDKNNLNTTSNQFCQENQNEQNLQNKIGYVKYNERLQHSNMK